MKKAGCILMSLILTLSAAGCKPQVNSSGTPVTTANFTIDPAVPESEAFQLPGLLSSQAVLQQNTVLKMWGQYAVDGPVSYTHLVTCAMSDSSLAAWLTPTDAAKLKNENTSLSAPYYQPVSYTHLDVYKRQVLERAVKWQIIQDNPAHRIDAPKVDRKQIQYLDDQQAAISLEKEPLEYQAIFSILLLTGKMCIRDRQVCVPPYTP